MEYATIGVCPKMGFSPIAACNIVQIAIDRIHHRHKDIGKDWEELEGTKVPSVTPSPLVYRQLQQRRWPIQ